MAYRRASSYRRLTIAQAKRALDAGFELLAADGQVCFRSSDVMRAPFNFPTTTLHRATFDHLCKAGLIQVNESKSKLPPSTLFWTLARGGNYYAVWESTKAKEDHV